MSRINLLTALLLLGALSACTEDQSTSVRTVGERPATALLVRPMHPPTVLTVGGSGTGQGNVTDSQHAISCAVNAGSTSGTCSASWAFPGPWDTLTASPASGSAFTGWTGDCTGTGPCVVQMLSSHNVVATFTATSYTLTIHGAGNDSGLVFTPPGGSGIYCTIVAGQTSGTCSSAFSSDSVVGLKRITNGAFGGWSGDCTGSGLMCYVTMNTNKNVTATFNHSN